jgi:peroxiredoxin
MKKIISSSLLILSLVTTFIGLHRCTPERNSGTYTITGYVKGIASDSVYLYNTVTNKIEPTPVVNDRFSFAGTVAFPEMYEVYFDSALTKFVRLFLENSSISISGNIDSLENIEIRGSDSNREYLNYSKSIHTQRTELRNTEKLFETALSKRDYAKADSLEVIINHTAHLLLEEAHRYASVNKSSAIVPYITYMACLSAPDKLLAEQIIQIIADAGKNIPRIAALKKFLADIERTAVGSQAIDFEMMSRDGQLIKLSDYKGKVIMLDFWASWCAPCIKEFPDLKEIYNQFRENEFEIIGFSIDKDKKAWENMLDKHKLPWPQVVELNGAAGITPKDYGIIFIPTVYLIDTEGKIAGTNLHGNRLTDKIKELLNLVD